MITPSHEAGRIVLSVNCKWSMEVFYPHPGSYKIKGLEMRREDIPLQSVEERVFINQTGGDKRLRGVIGEVRMSRLGYWKVGSISRDMMKMLYCNQKEIEDYAGDKGRVWLYQYSSPQLYWKTRPLADFGISHIPQFYAYAQCSFEELETIRMEGIRS